MAVANVQITQLLLKRGNTTRSDSYIGVRSELTHDTGPAGNGPHTVRIHDGRHAGGTILATQEWVSDNFANGVGGGGTIYGNSNVASYMAHFNSNIIPSSNSVYSLGSSTHQWKDIWVSNATIYMNTIPLSVSNSGNLTFNGHPLVSFVNGNLNVGGSTVTAKTINSAAVIGGNLTLHLADGRTLDVGEVVGPQGIQGLTGPHGPQGNVGPQGSQGIKGDQGERGLPGAKGDKGDTGDVGATGATGPRGFTGNTGPKGDQGDPGERGPTGEQGVSVTLIGNVTLPSDLTFSGNAGEAYIVTSTGNLFFWNTQISNWADIGPIVGPQGDPGPQGERGIQGNIGLTGADGADGKDGKDGRDGVDGARGSVWFSGSEDPQANIEGLQNLDFYFKTTDGSVWQFAAGIQTWYLLDNLTGPQGETGPQGPGADQDLNTYNNVQFANITLTNGDDLDGTNGLNQLTFTYGGQTTTPHFIRTRHNGEPSGNAFDFYTSDGTDYSDNPVLGLTIENGNIVLGNDILAHPSNDINIKVFDPGVEGAGVVISLQNRDIDTGNKTTQLNVTPADIELTTDFSGAQHTLTLDSNGQLQLPTGGTLGKYWGDANETTLYASEGGYTALTHAVGWNSVKVDQYSARIKTNNNYEWTFDRNGILTLPVGYNGWSNLYTPSNAPLNIQTTGDNIAQIELKPGVSNGAGIQFYTAGGTKGWLFDYDGTTHFAGGYTFPADNGGAGQVLVNDGSGNLTWQDQTGNGGGGGGVNGLYGTTEDPVNTGDLSYVLAINTVNVSDTAYLRVYKGGSLQLGKAGNQSRGSHAIAIGNDDVGYQQKDRSIAIGYQAGWADINPMGYDSIAIGNGAAYGEAANNSIILNATGSAFDSQTSGFFVKPIREVGENTAKALYYNDSTGELTFTTPVSPFDQDLNTYNNVTFNTVNFALGSGVADPSTTGRSEGTKIVLWPEAHVEGHADYAIGITDYSIWNSVPLSDDGNSIYHFKWFAGNTEILDVDGYGKLTTTGPIQSQPIPGNFSFESGITGIDIGLQVNVYLSDNVFESEVRGRVVIAGVRGTTQINGTWYYDATDVNVITLYTDNTYSTLVDGSLWGLYLDGGLVRTVDHTDLQIISANTTITNNSYSWSFTPDGRLTVPENGVQFPNGSFIQQRQEEGLILWQPENNGIDPINDTEYIGLWYGGNTVNRDLPRVSITAGTDSWATDDGNLHNTNYAEGNQYQINFDIVTDPDPDFGVTLNWHLDADGNLYLPAEPSVVGNIGIVFSDGTLQTTASSTGEFVFNGNVLTTTAGNDMTLDSADGDIFIGANDNIVFDYAGGSGSIIIRNTQEDGYDDPTTQSTLYVGRIWHEWGTMTIQSDGRIEQANDPGNLVPAYGALRLTNIDNSAFIIIPEPASAFNDQTVGNVEIVNTDYAWQFSPDGNLTLPQFITSPAPVSNTGITFGDNTFQDTAWQGAAIISETAPADAKGRLWFNSTDARTYVKYNNQWVDASPAVIPLASTYTGELVIEETTISNSDYTGTKDIVVENGGKSWKFTSAGEVVFPDNTVQTSAWTNPPLLEIDGGDASSWT